MNATLIIGWKFTSGKPLHPECLYCGLDGIEAAKIAFEAVGAGFTVLKRIGPYLSGVSLPTYKEAAPVVQTPPETPEVAEEGDTTLSATETPGEAEAPKSAKRRRSSN